MAVLLALLLLCMTCLSGANRVAVGNAYACFLTDTNDVRCARNNGVSLPSLPAHIVNGGNVIALADHSGSARCSCAMLQNSSVVCWGLICSASNVLNNDIIEVVVADNVPVTRHRSNPSFPVCHGSCTPFPIIDTTDLDIIRLYVEVGISCIIVRSRLNNTDAAICNFAPGPSLVWKRLHVPSFEIADSTTGIVDRPRIVDMCFSGTHACVLYVNGFLDCADNGNQTSIINRQDTLRYRFRSVVCGNSYACAIEMESGTLRCWGTIQLPLYSDWVEMAGAGTFACGIGYSGSSDVVPRISCFGGNSFSVHNIHWKQTTGNGCGIDSVNGWFYCDVGRQLGQVTVDHYTFNKAYAPFVWISSYYLPSGTCYFGYSARISDFVIINPNICGFSSPSNLFAINSLKEVIQSNPSEITNTCSGNRFTCSMLTNGTVICNGPFEAFDNSSTLFLSAWPSISNITYRSIACSSRSLCAIEAFSGRLRCIGTGTGSLVPSTQAAIDAVPKNLFSLAYTNVAICGLFNDTMTMHCIDRPPIISTGILYQPLRALIAAVDIYCAVLQANDTVLCNVITPSVSFEGSMPLTRWMCSTTECCLMSDLNSLFQYRGFCVGIYSSLFTNGLIPIYPPRLAPIGYYRSSNGTDLPCPIGTFGTRPGLSSPVCTASCTGGTYQPLSGQTSCGFDCPVGHYCPAASSSPRKCPAGRFGVVQRESSALCSGPCPLGYYCPEGTNSSTSFPCPAGRFGDVTGLSSSSCSGPCSPGYYCPVASTSSMQLPCDASDSYCPVGSGSPVRVTTGYYKTSPSSEAPCPPGYSCFSGVATPCAQGRFANDSGLTTCSECLVDTFTNATGQTTCAWCSSGQYAPIRGSTVCLDCAPGQYREDPLLDSSTGVCSSCVSGSFSNSSASSSCTSCQPGSFQASPLQTQCYACQPGSFSNSTGASSCFRCAVGWRQESAGSTACVQCLAGTFQNAEGGVSCSECPSGSYSSVNGSTSCNKCPQGRYASTQGMSTCLSCGFGLVSPVEGQSRCVPCADGFPNENATECVRYVCARGYFFDRTIAECQACPAGKYGVGGDLVDTGACVDCPSGSYSTMNASTACFRCSDVDSKFTCVAGQVYVGPGVWVTRDEDGRLISDYCPETMCLGWTSEGGVICSENRLASESNLMCRDCKPGYSEWGGRCVPCDDETNGGYVLLWIIASWIYVYFLHRLSQKTVGITGIFLYYVQVVRLIIRIVTATIPRMDADGQVDTSQERNAFGMTSWLHFMELDAQYINLERCPMNVSSTTRYLLSVGSTGLAFIQLYLTCVIEYVYVRYFSHPTQRCKPILVRGDSPENRIRAKTKLTYIKDSYFRSGVALLMFSYSKQAIACLNYFICNTVGDHSFLRADPSVACDQDSWRNGLALVIIVFILHMFVFVALCAWMMWYIMKATQNKVSDKYVDVVNSSSSQPSPHPPPPSQNITPRLGGDDQSSSTSTTTTVNVQPRTPPPPDHPPQNTHPQQEEVHENKTPRESASSSSLTTTTFSVPTRMGSALGTPDGSSSGSSSSSSMVNTQCVNTHVPKDWTHRLGVLIEPFQTETYWWQMTILLRRLILAIVVTFVIDSSFALSLIGVVNLCVLALNIQKQPYYLKRDNYFESVCVFVSLVLVMLGLKVVEANSRLTAAAASTMDDETLNITEAMLLMCVICTCFIAAYFLGSVLMSKWRLVYHACCFCCPCYKPPHPGELIPKIDTSLTFSKADAAIVTPASPVHPLPSNASIVHTATLRHSQSIELGALGLARNRTSTTGEGLEAPPDKRPETSNGTLTPTTVVISDV